jgi:galactokinase
VTQLPDVTQFIKTIRAHTGAEKFFQPGKTIYLSRAPGRLDLMGGNDDYTGGLVFETTIREATRVAVQLRDDDRIRLFNPQMREQGWRELVECSLAALATDTGLRSLEEVRAFVNADVKQQWIAYVIGALYLLKKEFPSRVTHGVSIWLESEVPLGKGVSSSAALEVAAMKALGAAFGIRIEGVQLALWTQWVENAIAQSASGVMDQITVVLGDQDHFVPLICQPCQPEPLVRLPAPLRIWGVDSGVRHSVAGIEYETARAATFMGYAMLCDWEKLPVFQKPLRGNHREPLCRIERQDNALVLCVCAVIFQKARFDFSGRLNHRGIIGLLGAQAALPRILAIVARKIQLGVVQCLAHLTHKIAARVQANVIKVNEIGNNDIIALPVPLRTMRLWNLAKFCAHLAIACAPEHLFYKA